MTDASFRLPIPELDRFEQAADPALYARIPDDWSIGVADVVDSRRAIDSGNYKRVNFAGAAAISAVSNALGGTPFLFVFAGDGARFVVAPDQADIAADALSRVAAWTCRDLELDLRVGMEKVAKAREAGHDVRAAFFRASEHARYAMFVGGGLQWAEEQLKIGAIRFAHAAHDDEPDLTGLSCQWGPLVAERGKIVSLIVKRSDGATEKAFARCISDVVALLDSSGRLNPVPSDGPDVRWPLESMNLQSRIPSAKAAWLRRLNVISKTAVAWLLFKTGIKVGAFDSDRYRREIADNSDFRKFDDALLMTVDCSADTIDKLRGLLDAAKAAGTVRYGMHLQDKALLTCVVPSVTDSGHMHFVDGADGGYAAAVRAMG